MSLATSCCVLEYLPHRYNSIINVCVLAHGCNLFLSPFIVVAAAAMSSLIIGKYYYEATIADGLCRVGWATPQATRDLGGK